MQKEVGDLASPEENQTAVSLLRLGAGRLVDEWRLACVADVVGPPDGAREADDGLTGARVRALIAMAGTSVIAALATVIEDPARAEGSSSPLTAVADLLVDNNVAVATPIRQLALLRQVLHRHAVETLPANAVGPADRDFSSAVDALMEACAVRTAERLEQAAFVDHLTGLLNRRALDRDLSRELAVAERHGRRVSLIRFDVDGLKRINDVRGHNDGDDALCRLASALRAGLRQGDTAYRVGGIEFMALLPGTSQDGVARLMARVRAGDPPAFSWGAATFPDDVTNRPSLLELVDRRLVAHRGGIGASSTSPGSARLAAAREAGSGGRSRSRRPALVAAFLAGLLLGGAGLAAATTGGLPAPIQNAAHTVFAKLGVPVPSDAGDKARQERENRAPAASAPSKGRFLGDITTPCTYPGGAPFVGTHGQYVAANPDKPDTPANERWLAARSPCGQPLEGVPGGQNAPSPGKRSDGVGSEDKGAPQNEDKVGSETSVPVAGRGRPSEEPGGRPPDPGGPSRQERQEPQKPQESKEPQERPKAKLTPTSAAAKVGEIETPAPGPRYDSPVGKSPSRAPGPE